MALLRKDLKIGFLAGAVLLAIAVGYALVLTFSGSGSPQQAAGSVDPLAGDLPADGRAGENGAAAPQSNAADSSRNPPAGAAQQQPADDWGSAFGFNGKPPHVTQTPDPSQAAAADRPDGAIDDGDFLPPSPDLNQQPPVDAAAPAAGVVNPAVAPQRGVSADVGGSAGAAPTGMQTHVIVSGDSFSSIAEKYYGNANLYTLLQKANPNVDSRRLKLGQKILVPDREADASRPTSRPSTTQEPLSDVPGGGTGGALGGADAGDGDGVPVTDDASTYTVAAGDTLLGIAASRLGRASMWEQLYKLNRDVIGDDPAALKVGTKLKLPQ